MSKILVVVALLACAACKPAQPPETQAQRSDVAAWHAQAQRVTITRDDWGIPHVRGTSDADAVFGLIYAHAEDDFNRIEQNYLLSLGRLAEAEGEKELWRDLRMRLFIDPEEIKPQYASSPEWLRSLMDAWAAGLNYYLATHPAVKPRVLTRFEPWMALTFSEGSIGGDIERVSLEQLQAFYEAPAQKTAANVTGLAPFEPTGSNGFAIAPSRSASKHALLWINPHTSFFFRGEGQMTSDEGLNAYGAFTWGQFFVYQGFNEHAGWMHTSSGVDNIDEYLETVASTPSGYVYHYGNERRPFDTRTVSIRYKRGDGFATREFVVYRNHRGPIVRRNGERWVSVRLMEEPVKALTQSYTRTKAKNLQEFMAIMELHANSSNNTVFADSQGNIAYLHSNFIPKRNRELDWTQPVDGSDPATDWQGVHSVAEAPNVINPESGWLYNTNNAPWSAAGAASPRQKDFPAYVDGAGENPRGVHAIRVLSPGKSFSSSDVIAAAFDSEMPAFESLIPKLLEAYGDRSIKPADKTKLAKPIFALQAWDRRWSAQSVATTLAVLWGDELWRRTDKPGRTGAQAYADVEQANATDRIAALVAVVDRLESDFGTWEVPWGEMNRFQRLTSDIIQPFSDAAPSLPVPFATARWGSLATFGARSFNGTKKIYGTTGNSFLAVVEFGDKVSARAITAGGQSGHPESQHFNDQAQRYASGDLREVYFYPEQLAKHTELSYHPGER